MYKVYIKKKQRMVVETQDFAEVVPIKLFQRVEEIYPKPPANWLFLSL